MRQVSRPIRDFVERLVRPAEGQSGQSLVIVAFAFLGLVAMLGLALDLGLVYIERVAIKRAVDAATLAGVVELPYEQESFKRAIEYLDLNDYPADETSIYVLGCIRDVQDVDTDGDYDELINATTPYAYQVAVQPTSVFTFDTRAFQLADDVTEFNCKAASNIYGTANKLLITGTTWVPMNFMQFFGFDSTPVTDAAIAQNVSNLDVVVVMDRTGSMDFDTICFNCFERTETDDVTNPNYVDYPENGVRYTVVSATTTSNLCGDTVTPISYGGEHYQILEAELYSYNSSTWERRYRSPGRGYWAINRNWTNTWKVPKPIDPLDEPTAPGAVSHHPYITFTDNDPSSPLFGRFYSLADASSGVAPRLEYDFALPDSWDGNTAHIWIRGRQNGEWPGWSDELDGTNNPDVIYWAVNEGTISKADDTQGNGVGTGWTWVKLGSVSSLATGDAPYTWHTLKIWAGSPGYTIDRIIITDDSGSLESRVSSSIDKARAQNEPGNPAHHNWTTPGSARRQACDPCNPIFGLNITDNRTQAEGGQCLGYYQLYEPTDNLANDLFADNEPIRSSKEAVKNFIGRLDPEYDQVGFVYYNNTATKGSELMCRRQYLTQCYEGVAAWGWPGGPTPYTYTLVLNSVEDQSSLNATCTACGMRAGLEVLGINVDDRGGVDNDCDGSADSACGRGAASTRVMVLLTDGVPNLQPGNPTPCDDDPSLWANGPAPHDCGIYYARKAGEAGVVIYSIGLGAGVDIPWLQAIAEESKGQFYQAPTPNDLDLIFEEILSNIYVRLIR